MPLTGLRASLEVRRRVTSTRASPSVEDPKSTLQRRKDLVHTPKSKLLMFLDSANISQIDLWHNSGIFHGITTNPTILERDKVKCNVRSLTKFAVSAFELGAEEIQLQSWGDTAAKLSSVAFDLAGIDPKRIVVKLPCTHEGLHTAALLRDANIRVTVTGIYSSQQVLLAEAVGAEYAAPYLGRMNDVYGENLGTTAVVQMQEVLNMHQSKTRLLVASIRDPMEMVNLSQRGCDTFTFSPTVANKMFNVQFTLDVAADFQAAAERNGAMEMD